MINIRYQNFRLREDYFENHSSRHGINHTYRVMFHVLKIGKMAHLEAEILLAWCAAFIHDMAREHDHYCTEHGGWSAEKKLPLFSEMFRQEGVDDAGLEAIRLAVENHSLREEILQDHPHYKVVALLKDADALDRIRISETNLKVKYLRFPESLQCVEFARKLYFETAGLELKSFEQLLDLADKIG